MQVTKIKEDISISYISALCSQSVYRLWRCADI